MEINWMKYKKENKNNTRLVRIKRLEIDPAKWKIKNDAN